MSVSISPTVNASIGEATLSVVSSTVEIVSQTYSVSIGEVTVNVKIATTLTLTVQTL
jgi:hypothetical protein